MSNDSKVMAAFAAFIISLAALGFYAIRSIEKADKACIKLCAPHWGREYRGVCQCDLLREVR